MEQHKNIPHRDEKGTPNILNEKSPGLGEKV